MLRNLIEGNWFFDIPNEDNALMSHMKARHFIVLEITGTQSPETAALITEAVIKAGNNLVVGVKVNPTLAREIYATGYRTGVEDISRMNKFKQ